jgi:demethylmenaquinone methyltransferase/2-methoxy-6-polyprenyl-1,4-benzoquinol methylase
MFSRVSERYDLLNRLMSLGRDGAWRRAMWSLVPDDARTVLDLCTGSGASLPGLRRAGRLVLGVDVSGPMLEMAAAGESRRGWAPRLVCADAFHLPLPEGSIDAVTIAFGMRNLRPRDRALAEIARVLRPGGRLIVLEATAPRRGLLAPFHAFYLRSVIPSLGRLSPDPTAYAYLSRSIFEFGAGDEFERDLMQAGFRIAERRGFMLGATRLWVAERGPSPAANPREETRSLQPATLGELPRGEMRSLSPSRSAEWRWWNGIQLLLSAALVVALGYALRVYSQLGSGLPLAPWQRRSLHFLLVAGAIGFAVRTVVLWLRLRDSPPRR